MRARQIGAIAAAVAVLGGVLWSAPVLAAGADATDYGLAVAANEGDRSNAVMVAASENAESPDITCGNPTAVGSFITPGVAAHPVGTVDGNDIASANGQCLSLQGSTFSATLVLSVEYNPKGAAPNTWSVILRCVGKTIQPSAGGAASPIVPDVPCNIPVGDPAFGRPQRAHAHLTNSLTTNTYDGYSIPWDTTTALAVSY